jgi:high-affinity Fe2+/Pb2+ permease
MPTQMLHRLSKPIALAPAVLVAYAFFAVIVTVADFAVLPLTSKHLQEWLVPRTGWVASMFYAFTIFFTLDFIFRHEGRTRNRLTITGFLAFQVVIGLWDLSRMQDENYGNPYLTISPWRSVWTIIIPSLWIIALYLPSMNRFCEQPEKSQDA